MEFDGNMTILEYTDNIDTHKVDHPPKTVYIQTVGVNVQILTNEDLNIIY